MWTRFMEILSRKSKPRCLLQRWKWGFTLTRNEKKRSDLLNLNLLWNHVFSIQLIHTLVLKLKFFWHHTYITINTNLDAESRITVVYWKYFHAHYLLNFPSTWGLGFTRICLFYFHLKLVESGNFGLNIFVLFAIDYCNLSSINDLMFS